MLKYRDDIVSDVAKTTAINQDSACNQAQSVQNLGDFAYQILIAQFHYILTQEQGVIEDKDPEYLHQMRVGFRKLQAAISVFSPVISSHSTLKAKDYKPILRHLGTLRDLDVQLEKLTKKIQNASTPGHQRSLIRLQRTLKPKRHKAYKRVYKTLAKSHAYQKFKTHMNDWLKHPQYEAIATLPVEYCAPELLSPLLSQLLLHPAWFISLTEATHEQLNTLHDLRKLCKQLRYQNEFFRPFYAQAFKKWIKEIKELQSLLGDLQDTCVFEKLMQRYQGQSVRNQTEAIARTAHRSAKDRRNHHPTSLTLEWDRVRQRYCDPIYRQQLRTLISSPSI